jgi:serine protease Do
VNRISLLRLASALLLLAGTVPVTGIQSRAVNEDGPTAPGQGSPDLSLVIHQAAARIVKLYGATIGGEHGYGTGVVVSADGRVVTTLSLLLEASNLRAVTPDGHTYQAEVIYRDEYRQLALLQMKRYPEDVDTDASINQQMTPLRLDPMPLGNSTDIRGGEWVLAVGNPFKVAEGEEPVSALKGIVSGRTNLEAVRGTQPFPYRGEVLVLDAITSNPGSPGSALITFDGRWIGLIGKTVTSKLTNTFLNYAYPIEEVTAFLQDARSGASAATQPSPADAPQGYHGIRLSRIGYRRTLPFVERVAMNSPAAEAGVKPDDLIVSANGTAIPHARAFNELCERLRVGEELSLIIKRGNELVPVRMKLTEPPK